MRIALYFSLFLVSLAGIIYALPAFYPMLPAVDIASSNSSTTFSTSTEKALQKALAEEGVSGGAIRTTPGHIQIGVTDFAEQLKVKEIVEFTLGDQAVVTLGRFTTMPSWLSAIGARPLNLGLDLQGGVHFVLQVDLPKAVEGYVRSLAAETRNTLRQEKIRFLPVPQDQATVVGLQFANTKSRNQALELLVDRYHQFVWEEAQYQGKSGIKGTVQDTEIIQIHKYALEQNVTTLRNRVNELGVSEPAVFRQGTDKIVVQLPGVQDTTNAKKIIGATANLEFRLEAEGDAPVFTREPFPFRDNQVRTAQLEKEIIVTGDNVSFAKMSFDETGLPQVEITLDSVGGSKMKSATRNAVKRNMAVVFIETKTRTNYSVDAQGKRTKEQNPYVEKHIISLATIQAVLGNSFRITGLDNAKEASDLALLLRAGALAAPMYFVQENVIGPSLGAENIEKGTLSLLVGFMLVVLFMLIRYRAFGVVANISLLLNVFLLGAIMSLLHATLTLPGIAGIVLTVGMAVDANVLVFSRIKEEYNNGLSLKQALEAGYSRALVTIADANITTLIVAIILFAVGTGAVKGFAVTLAIGIITSIFTAVLVSRALARLLLTTPLTTRYYL